MTTTAQNKGRRVEFDAGMIANGKIAAGAAAGGVMRMFLRPVRSLGQMAALLASCVTCGFYGTGPLLNWLTLPEDYAGAVGALLGFVGLSLAERLLKAVDEMDVAAMLLKLIRK
jgi:hypothetical protein